jgi:tetratricopeptide (TPR) repeat protein
VSPTLIGSRLRLQGQFARAEPLLREALAAAEQAPSSEGRALIEALNALGLLCKDLGRYDEARRHYGRALELLERAEAADPDDVATLYHNLGGIEHARGDYAAGEGFARRGLAIRTSLDNADPFLIAADDVALAAILDGLARYTEAERLYLEAVTIFERTPGEHDVELSVALNDLGAQYARRGRHEQAAELLTRAVDLKRHALGPRHPDTAITLNNLAITYKRAGEFSRAAALAAEALGMLEEALPADHPRLAVCRGNAAECAAKARTDEANGGGA